MALEHVEWSHAKSTTVYGLERHKFEFSLRRNKAGKNLETLQFGTDDNFESAPFPVNEQSVLAYFHAHEERLDALFTFSFGSTDAFENQAEEWGAEFPQAEIFIIWADSDLVESRWVAVGFDDPNAAGIFKRKYIARARNTTFEYRSAMSKEQ